MAGMTFSPVSSLRQSSASQPRSSTNFRIFFN